MKLRNLLILSLSFVLYSVSQPSHADVSGTLQKLLFNNDLKRSCSPADPMWRVVSAAFWNSQTGFINKSDLDELRADLLSDQGRAAADLFSEGYNYHVLNRLRWVLGVDPLGVSYGVIDVGSFQSTALGLQPAGIAEFQRVNRAEWDTNAQGQLILTYEPRLQWLLEKSRLLLDSAVTKAGATPHGLKNLFVSRYKQVDAIVAFQDDFEKVLVKLQGLKSSLVIKKSRISPQEVAKHEKLAQLIQEVDVYLDGFLTWGRDVLAKAQPAREGDKTPWEEYARAIRSQNSQFAEFKDSAEKLIREKLNQVDEAMGDVQSSNRYANDLPPELELARREHIETLKKLSDAWLQLKNRSYYRRTHGWPSIHQHSEENGPYLETGREIKERAIHDIDPAPYEEVELAEQLAAIGYRLTQTKMQGDAILRARERLTELKKVHDEHIKRGPKLEPNAPEGLANGFAAHFSARNKALSDWLNFLMDSSYRHEAHEKNGYIGLELDKKIDARYEAVLKRLAVVARRFNIAFYSLAGTVGTGGGFACVQLLTHQ